MKKKNKSWAKQKSEFFDWLLGGPIMNYKVEEIKRGGRYGVDTITINFLISKGSNFENRWDAEEKPIMWDHWCPVENSIMGIGKGEECNWCGQDEEYESRNRRYRDRLTTTNKDSLHSNKRS